MNGVPSNVHFLDVAATEDVVSTTDQFAKLDEKLDDIRTSLTVFAVDQAKMAGTIATLNQQVGDMNALREKVATLTVKVQSMETDKLWSRFETVVKAAVGGGLALGAQYFLK